MFVMVQGLTCAAASVAMQAYCHHFAFVAAFVGVVLAVMPAE
jgi:hypothetical protein